jgi:hypothetical protein
MKIIKFVEVSTELEAIIKSFFNRKITAICYNEKEELFYSYKKGFLENRIKLKKLFSKDAYETAKDMNYKDIWTSYLFFSKMYDFHFTIALNKINKRLEKYK